MSLRRETKVLDDHIEFAFSDSKRRKGNETENRIIAHAHGEHRSVFGRLHHCEIAENKKEANRRLRRSNTKRDAETASNGRATTRKRCDDRFMF